MGDKFKIDKKVLLVNFILFFLLSRIVIDVAWSETKPDAIVVFYTVLAVFISAYLLVSAKGVAVKIFIPLLLLIFPSTLLISQMYSDVGFFDHIRFIMQVYIPCLFMVAATTRVNVFRLAAEKYKQRFSVAVFLLLLAASYLLFIKYSLPGVGFYQHYQNAPNHVLAQTLLKCALPLLAAGMGWVVVSFIFVFVLNVRSVIFAYMLPFFFAYKDVLLKKGYLKRIALFGLPLLVLFIIQVDWADFYQRLVFKGRDLDSSANLNSASSGRVEILQMYFFYMLDSFGLKEWLFGAGPIWLADNGPRLSAHNDILNLIVSVGLVGMTGTLLCYWYFFTSLSGKAKYIFLLSFTVLFLSNGVVFHQSNILYSFLFLFSSGVKRG